MKLISAILLSILLSSFSTDERFDQYGNLCFEDERARLDNFAVALKADDTTLGYIIVFAARSSCADEAKYRGNRAKDCLVKQGVKSDRVIVKDGGYKPEGQTILVLADKQQDPPHYPSNLEKKDVSIHKCVDKVFARVLCPDRR